MRRRKVLHFCGLVVPSCRRVGGLLKLHRYVRHVLSKSARVPIRPGKENIFPLNVSPRLDAPKHIVRPPYAIDEDHWYNVPQHDIDQQLEIVMKRGFPIKSKEDIEKMRESCKIAKEVLNYAGSLVKPGITTDEIDAKAFEKIISLGAYPSPLNYLGYPKSICTSPNEIVCHGIPDSRELEDGDILNIDVTVFKNGFHGDTSRMFTVGKIDRQAQRLIDASTEATYAGIAAVGPGKDFRGIGEAISLVAEKHDFSVPDFLCGHGIGKVFHDIPIILHTRNSHDIGLMQVGMTFTVEPVVIEGDEAVHMGDDDWTITTVDKGWSAQCEHTVLVSENGVEILT